MCDDIKRSNIYVTGVPEGEENEDRAVKTFEEIMAGNFPDLGKGKNIHI